MNTQEWLTRLVSYDTTSRNSNLALIADIDDWFKKHHIITRLTYDSTQQKANIVATLPGTNGLNGGIVLSGHTDVVPVDGQIWDTDPFSATYKDQKIYGRGTCDMKGFLAVILALVPHFQGLTRKLPLHFAFSYDEETGCLGAPQLISDMQAAGMQPAACLVGEPTSMRPIVAHKGIQVYRCQIKGVAAHSSLTPEGCNAIEYAAKLISFIRHLAAEIRIMGPFDNDFDVPFTSISTNMISGGIAQNTIPDTCEFHFEFRNLPAIAPQEIITKINTFVQQELLPQMRKEKLDAAIVFERIASVPSFEVAHTARITQLASEMSGFPEIKKLAYATEAGLFEQAKISTIVCGPGSIEQAHRANEYVEVEQLERCEDFVKRLVAKFCG